jgi:hypothetical protein
VQEPTRNDQEPTYDELQAELAAAIEQLETVTELDEGIAAGASALARGLRVELLALSTSIGVCRNAIPFSPLHPVLENGKIRWCCNHSPEQHCGT